MATKPNFERGVRYFYVHKSSLACATLGVATDIRLHRKCPKPRSAFHRCDIVVIRTPREAKTLDAKWAKRRAKWLAGVAKLSRAR